MIKEIESKWLNWSQSLSGRRWLDDLRKKFSIFHEWEMSQLATPGLNISMDPLQYHLVQLAQDGDPHSCNALILQMVPALRSIKRSFRSTSESDIVSCFCETVLTHNLQRRPVKIAANLALDTKQKFFRANSKEIRNAKSIANQKLTLKNQKPDNYSSNPSYYLYLVWSQAAMDKVMQNKSNSYQDSTKQIALRRWVNGDTVQELAAEFNLSPTNITTRLWRLRKDLVAELNQLA